MIIAATGHRPNKLGGYGPAAQKRRLDLAFAYLSEQRPAGVISGMALGWDTAFAQAAECLRIPIHAAVPFEGQERQWPEASQREFRRLLQICASVTIVCPGGYSPRSMQVRNEWVVDRGHKVAALWDGTSGGTGNCVRYAVAVRKPIDQLWQRWAQIKS